MALQRCGADGTAVRAGLTRSTARSPLGIGMMVIGVLLIAA